MIPVVIRKLAWPGAFVLTRVSRVCVGHHIGLTHFQKPQRYNGKVFNWALEYREVNETTGVSEKHQRYWLPAKNKAEAEEALDREKRRFAAWKKRLKLVLEPKALTAQELNIHHAQWKVLSKTWPKTVTALKEIDYHSRLHQKLTEERTITTTTEHEDLERVAVMAWSFETSRFIGHPVHCYPEDLSPQTQLQFAVTLAEILTTKAKGIDAIDYELAAGWKSKDYNAMSAKELAAAVSRALKVATAIPASRIKKRRQRLGLETLRDPGPPPRQ